MTPGSLVNRRGIRTILVGSGLAGLLGATACAVASVSGWLVPAYLLAVVVILTAPRGPRVPSQATGTTSGASGLGLSEPGRDPGDGQADETGHSVARPGSRSDLRAAAAEPDDAEPANLRLDPATSAIPKPRKSRARSRKTARTADSPGPDPAPVIWVRVGPGQYVRSDTIPQGHTPVAAPAPAEVPAPAEAPADAEAPPAVEAPASIEAPPLAEELPPAEVTAVAAHGDPVTDQPGPAAHEPAALVEASPAAEVPEANTPASKEPATCAQPATVEPFAEIIPTPGGEAMETPPTAEFLEREPTATKVVPVVEPVAEEYGIAPSAFGPSATEPLASEGPEEDVLESIEPTVFDPDPGLIDDLDATAPESDPTVEGTSHRRRGPRTPPLFVPRSLVHRSPARDSRVMPSRHDVRGPDRPRATVRGSSTRGPRQAGDARRAYGRSEYIRHTWRARSPPGSS
jgi:hypothetical protein